MTPRLSIARKDVGMIFDGPPGSGLRYDTAIHDFIDESGSMATAERVAEVFEVSVEEVEQDRRERERRSIDE